jgi:hypothetical protein
MACSGTALPFLKVPENKVISPFEKTKVPQFAVEFSLQLTVFYF